MIIFQYDQGSIDVSGIDCDYCGVRKLRVVGFDKNSTEELHSLQEQISHLTERLSEFQRVLDEDTLLEDTDGREFNTKH